VLFYSLQKLSPSDVLVHLADLYVVVVHLLELWMASRLFDPLKLFKQNLVHFGKLLLLMMTRLLGFVVHDGWH
jgi:hypothetical protein